MTATYRFAWNGHAVAVRADAEAPIALIARFLALEPEPEPEPRSEPAPRGGGASAADLAADIARTPAGWRIRGPFGAFSAASWEDAAQGLLETVALGFARAGRDVHLVHAGGFVADGGAIVFFGPSWSGKSSLAFAAWRRGLETLGDDRLCLDPAAGRARAFPKCLKLRLPAGAPLPEGRAGRPIDPDGGEAFVGALGDDRRLVLSRGLEGFADYRRTRPIRALVRIARDPEAARSRLDRMPATEALEGLLGEANGAAGDPMALVRLVKAQAPDGRIARLRVAEGDLDGALDALLAA